MPLIEAAGAVHVLTATTRRTGFEVSEELAAYLRWHGATCERHEVKAQDQPVGAALLGAARNAGADLLVMGAYSRSRFAELIFGGVTQHVLGHADLPVLLAH
jgi:nucleotide-binding universal stress UspA family protein